MSVKVFKEFDAPVKAELRAKLGIAQVNASGALSKSIRSEIFPKRYVLYSLEYMKWTEGGRGPTQKPGDGEVLKRIRRWIDDKPIKLLVPKRSDGTPRKHRDGSPLTIEEIKNRAAYAIAMKIHNLGTVLFRENKFRDVFTSVFTKERIDGLIADLSFVYSSQVKSDIIKEFKK